MEVIQSKINTAHLSPQSGDRETIDGKKRYNNFDLQNLTIISDREQLIDDDSQKSWDEEDNITDNKIK